MAIIHISDLGTVSNLGMLYADQGKVAEAMYLQALQGKEKAWGAEHTSTLGTVSNLGVLYKEPRQDGGGGGNVPAGPTRVQECSGSRSSENVSSRSQLRSASYEQDD